jgi:hypothetical protein
MLIFDITPAGTYVKATQAASESDRREAARRSSVTPRPQKSSLLLSVAETVRRAVAQAVKTTADLRSIADFRSRRV